MGKKIEKLERWAELIKESNFVHNKNMIAGFFGEYRFLSNYYYPARSFYQGYEFPTSENAYQAAKYFIIYGKWGNKLKYFQNCKNDESKKFWKDKEIDPEKLKKWMVYLKRKLLD